MDSKILTFVKNNSVALITAACIILFYFYFLFQGSVCYGCLQETQWQPSYGTNRHK